MGTSLVVRSQLKNYAKIDEKQINISADFFVELNRKVEQMIREACKRARQNNRNTVMARDL